MQEHGRRSHGEGFTLVEILITVVVVAVLTAVAIVGFAGIASKSDASACKVTLDAARAATVAFYAKSLTYPQNFADLTSPPASPPLLDRANGVTETATALHGKGGWTLRLSPNGPSNATTYQCT